MTLLHVGGLPPGMSARGTVRVTYADGRGGRQYVYANGRPVGVASEDAGGWRAFALPAAFCGRGPTDSGNPLLDTVADHLVGRVPGKIGMRPVTWGHASLNRAAQALLTYLVDNHAPAVGFGPHPEVDHFARRRDGVPLGLRRRRVARATGTLVALYDGEQAGMDTFAGRWQTVCEDHGAVISHRTRRIAEAWLSHPDEWCDVCKEEGQP